jgi:hypothetical protein
MRIRIPRIGWARARGLRLTIHWGRSSPTMWGADTITPRLVPEVQGVAYVLARCHLSNAERTFRLDRIRECWLDEDGMSRVREGREASEA